jgi:superfamily II DNA or RNA helicase
MADGPLFIVDNAPDGRKGRDYLREWTEIANGLDVASGFFEIGSLLDLDGHWQKLDKIRILMGDEISHRTRKVMLSAVRTRAESRLDSSLEDEKEPNPFLTGVGSIVEAMRSGKIECRVYTRDKFHAKTYITHGKLDVIGSQALVGSSNFTRPGLTQNVELNIKIESSSEVAQLQEWYERHWADAVDVTPEVLRVVERHARELSPFEVYAQALRTMFAEQEPSANEWDQNQSRVFPKLDRYQQEAYWALTNIARQHGGALLCDGVGLGKTFVGLMLLERLVLYENKRVVLFAPKAVKDSVWVPELRNHLGHIGGVDGSADFSNLSVFSHTDLSRGGDFPERFARIAELADAVVIDEAHHFRNRGRRGDPENPEERSRYFHLYDLIGGARHKTVFMLTATPINNSLNDFRHLVELFSRGDDAHFLRTLGVASLTGRLNTLTKSVRAKVGEDSVESEIAIEAGELLSGDALFKGLVVQRSRAYARASQIQQTGDAAAFPHREAPRVAEYSIRKSYGRLLELVDTAFKKEKPLFALPMYYPLAYYTGPDETIDSIEANRQAQVVGLIRTNFLKRFESSVHAFERSCDRLLRRLLAFVEKNSETTAEMKRYERWIDQHADMLERARTRQLALWGEVDDEDEDEDVVPPELLEKAEHLPRDEYDVPEILAETYLDLDQIAALLDETRSFSPKTDDKLQKLLRLLRTKELKTRKVLVFTEFADTARYLRRELVEAGVEGVAQIDSGSKVDRAQVIRRFSPYYNGLTSGELASDGSEEIRVLVATDVLSEGLNLQDATRMVNYDIHWNPVRLMQRIGRVDRRLNPMVEERIVADHPELADQRGVIAFWNFLPPGELDTLLSLYSKVSHKALVISKTLGIEGKKLLRPEDDYDALREFNSEYEGEATLQEELHLEYQRLLDEQPDLEEHLASLPRGVFSGKETAAAGSQAVFFCYRLPALDAESGRFSLEAGITRWYLCPLPQGEPVTDLDAIAEAIRSEPEAPRVCENEPQLLAEIRDRLLKHIRNTYLKQLDAPVDAPRPSLVCWMELKPS